MPAYRDACIHGLFHFDEATGVFVNRGLLGGTLTPVGAGHALSAASKFGANCYQAPASGAAGYISTATTFLRGMSPFMLSAWLYLTAYPGATVRRIIGVGQPSVPKPALEMNPDPIGAIGLTRPASLQAFPPTWPARIVGLTPPPPVYRAFWGGLGRIVGTTKIKGTPNTPVSRRVRLIREVDAVCVGERWSDPVTGGYAFNGFDPLQLYTVIVYDGPRVFRAAVQDAVVPEVYTP